MSDLTFYNDYAWIESIHRLFCAGALRATVSAPQGPTPVVRRGSSQQPRNNPRIGRYGEVPLRMPMRILGPAPQPIRKYGPSALSLPKSAGSAAAAAMLQPELFRARSRFHPSRRKNPAARRADAGTGRILLSSEKQRLAAAPAQFAHILPEARRAGPGSHARAPCSRLRQIRPYAGG